MGRGCIKIHVIKIHNLYQATHYSTHTHCLDITIALGFPNVPVHDKSTVTKT